MDDNMKKWSVKKTDPVVSEKLSRDIGENRLISDILVGRGIVSREDLELFINETELSDPFEIADMDKAVEAIEAALENGDKITVYGDYDCDGVTSTVILYQYLQTVGGEVSWYIPTRDEGYGLNMAAIDKIAADGTKLIITVDNGISAHKEADYIAEKGITLVITDHHQVPETLPNAYAVVNPHRSDDMCSCKNLAGCGVALKLAMALERDNETVFDMYGDMAAIGTVGDIVPLTGENRIIVRRGIENLTRDEEEYYSENAGLTALLKAAKMDEYRLDSTALAFAICPRINAAGRYDSPRHALDLFLCEDYDLAKTKAEYLNELNVLRQKTELEILSQVEQQISDNPGLLNQRVLVVSGENWNHGIIGIVSARLLQKYGKPNLVITIEGDTARGSARSVEGFSLYNLLDNCSDLLIKFGGHTKAAGFSVEAAKLEEFKERIYKYAEEKYPSMPADVICADAELKPGEITLQNVQRLSCLEPFGEANTVPLFYMRGCTLKNVKALKNGKYVSVTVDFGGREYKGVCFSMTFADFWYGMGSKIDLLVNLEENDYEATKQQYPVNLKIKEARLSDFNQDKYFAAKNTYEKMMCGEKVDPRLMKRIIPEKPVMKQVYDILRKSGRLSVISEMAFAQGINYCMLRVVLDVLEEFGLVKVDIVHNSAVIVPSVQKADLTKSEYLKKLRVLAEIE